MLKFVIDSPPRTSPHRPHVRAGVRRVFNGYRVDGLATILAWPHRPMAHARQIARRLTRPTRADYIAVIRQCECPGVVFIKPAFKPAATAA